MAVGQWFSYNQTENTIAFKSIEFNLIIPFLRGKNFLVKELLFLSEENETSLIENSDPTNWVKNEHHIYLSHLLEENFHNPICSASIELEGGGYVNFEYGKLYVKYPANVSLKKDTISLLEANGYFLASQVWDFCCENSEEILLDFILCKEDKDITDEFERMLIHSKSLK